MFDLETLLEAAGSTFRCPEGVVDWARSTGDDLVLAGALVVASHSEAEASDDEGAWSQTDRVIHRCEEAISIYSQLPSNQLQGKDREFHVRSYWTAHIRRGIFLDDLCEFDLALADFQRALDLATEYSYERGVLVAHANLVLTNTRLSNGSEALHHLMLLVAESERRRLGAADGSMLDMGVVRYRVAAQVYTGCGFLEDALELAKVARNEGGNTLDSVLLMAGQGVLALLSSKFDEAALILERILKSGRIAQHFRVRNVVTLIRAYLCAGRGDMETARREARRMVALDNWHGEMFVDPVVILMRILMLDDSLEEAIKVCDEQIVSRQVPFLNAMRLALKAECLGELGRWSEALLTLRQGEHLRRGVDLDPACYFDLSFPEGADLSVTAPPALADLYARQLHLRDFVGHDIRGLFTPVRLSFDLAQMAAEPDAAGTRLRRLVDGLDRMREVASNVDVYSLLVDLAPRDDLESLSVAEVVLAVVSRFRVEAARKGIEIKIDASHDVVALGDVDMLKAALGNLLSNAIKFTPSNRTVVVGWSAIGSQAGPAVGTTKLGAVEIFVEDDGPGLTREESASIFRQTSFSAALPTGGETSTGLGLQIVAGFVKSMGGTVRAEQSKDSGARFCITLKAMEELELNTQLKSEPVDLVTSLPRVESVAASRGGIRVLLFDDDPLILASVGDLIETLGGSSVPTSDFDEASRLVAEESFDFFILDVMIDGAPLGLELADLAASLEPDTPLVMMSAVDAAVGGYRLVRKPVAYQDLVGLFVGQDVGRDEREHPRRSPSLKEDPSAEPMLATLTSRLKARRPIPTRVFQTISQNEDSVVAGETLLLSAVNAEIEGRFTECLELADVALGHLKTSTRTPSPDRVWLLHHSVGLAHEATGNLEAAVTAFAEAIRFASEHGYKAGQCRSAVARATTYSALGDRKEALRCLVEAVDLVGADRSARADAFIALGHQLLSQGAATLAIMQFRHALANLNHLEIAKTRYTLFMLAQGYLQTQDPASARVTLNHSHATRSRYKMNDLESVRHRAIELAVDLAEGHPTVALAQAEVVFEQAMVLRDPSAARVALVVLVKCLARLGRHEEIVRRWGQNLPDESLKTERFCLQLATSCETVGDLQAAFGYTRQAYQFRINRNVGLPDLLTLIGRAATDLSDSYQSNNLADLVPEDGHFDLGVATRELIDLIDEAREYATRVIASRSDQANLDQLGYYIEKLTDKVNELNPSRPATLVDR